MRARVESASFAVAIALHLALGLLVVSRLPAPVVVPQEQPPIELEILTIEPADPAPATPPSPEDTAPIEDRRAAKMAYRSATHAPSESPDQSPEVAQPAPEVPYALDPRAAPATATKGRERAISLALPWMSGPSNAGESSVPAPPQEAPGDGLRKSLLRESAEHDRKLGLGIGSQVVAVAEPAIRQSGAPDGWAIVDIDFDGEGHMGAVSFRESDVTGFTAAVDALRSALASHTIKLPSGYRGARVRIKVVSRIRLPNGQKHAVELVRPFEGSDEPGKEKLPQEAALPKHLTWFDDLLPGDPHLMRKPPTQLDGSHFDAGLITLPLFKWDPSNTGAKQVFTVGITVMDVIPK